MINEIAKGIVDVLDVTAAEVGQAREAVKQELASNEAKPWVRAKLEHPGMVTTLLDEALRRQQALVYKLGERARVELPKAAALAIAYDIARDQLEAIKLSLKMKQANEADKGRGATQRASVPAEEVQPDSNIVPIPTPDLSTPAATAPKGQSEHAGKPARLALTLTNEAFQELAQAVVNSKPAETSSFAKSKMQVTPKLAAAIAGSVLRTEMTERQYWPEQGIDLGDYDQNKLIRALSSSLDSSSAKNGTAEFLVAAREGQARAFILERHKNNEEVFALALLDGATFATKAARDFGYNI